MKEKYEALDIKSQTIVDEFDERKPIYEKLEEVVNKFIQDALQDSRMEVTAVESRVKTSGSLIGKLVRKGGKYLSVDEITDVVGFRIITFFSDDVDKVASYMQRIFDIDWKSSIDKRKMHEMNSFGYNSLHYICRIPKSLYTDPDYPELNDIRFEIQMRSTLQHAWAAMEHDIGYKAEIEMPLEYKRMLGRLAGMLELADEEFVRIRVSVAAYRRKMESLIQAGALSEVKLDGDTYATYVAQKPFAKLMQRIADINQGEIQEMTFAPFFPLLKDMGMKTLQDVHDFIKENEEDAYKFAMIQFSDTDFDIIASTVALQDLLIVAALKMGGGMAALKHIYDVINGKSVHNERLAEMAYKQACKLPFMSK